MYAKVDKGNRSTILQVLDIFNKNFISMYNIPIVKYISYKLRSHPILAAEKKLTTDPSFSSLLP